MKNHALSLLAAATLLSPLYAQTTFDDVIVNASVRSDMALADVPDAIMVITAPMLENAHASTLQEALERLGHIAATSNGGPGQPTGFLLRGFDAKRVLVLIDGVRYNDVTGLSGAQYNFIHLDDVERIEIIKGSQSSVWGADASAGVINIVTKRAKKGYHANFDAALGSFKTRQGAIGLSYGAGRFDLSAGAAYHTTQGFSAAEPAKGTENYGQSGESLGWDNDAYRNRSYNAKAGFNITTDDRLEAQLRIIDAYVEYDAAAGMDAQNIDDPFGYGMSNYYSNNKNSFYSAAYSHRDNVNDLSLRYNLSTFERDQFGGYEGEVSEVLLQDLIAYGESAHLRIGGSHQTFEHSLNAGSALDKNYDATALFLTNFNKFTPLETLGNTIVTESLRYDRYDAFENKTTAKLGVKQYFSDTYALSFNLGTGYNVPTLYQLYDEWSGNPLLSPEKTQSYDLGIGNDMLKATFFYNEVDNLIDYDFATYAFANIEGTSKLKGVEVDYAVSPLDNLDASLHYTYLDAKNALGQRLASRPKHQVDAHMLYTIGAASAMVNAQYIGERFDQADEQGAQTGKYFLAHLSLTYKATDNVSLYGKIDNLTNKHYQVRDGYATAGRSATVGLNARY